MKPERYKFADPSVWAINMVFLNSKLTMDEIGRRMGYKAKEGRKSVWQLLNGVYDPRISTLRAFAKATGVSINELVFDGDIDDEVINSKKLAEAV